MNKVPIRIEKRKKIGILRGGPEESYDLSLKNAGKIFTHIYEHLSHAWEPVDIFVDREGVWHLKGLPINPSQLVHKIDLIWNTAHPSLAHTLKNLSIPHISTGHFSSAFEKSRLMLRDHLKTLGIQMPKHVVLPMYQDDFDGPKERYALKKAQEVFEKFPAPWIIKSLAPDPDMGIHVAATFPELVRGIEDGIAHKQSIVVEELIEGKEGEVHAIAPYRGEAIYTFPPIEIKNGEIRESTFSREEKDKLKQLTRDLYRHLGATHYLKSGFIVGKRAIYVTHVDLHPSLEDDSAFCYSCELVGAKPAHVIEHILEKALS